VNASLFTDKRWQVIFSKLGMVSIEDVYWTALDLSQHCYLQYRYSVVNWFVYILIWCDWSQKYTVSKINSTTLS